VFFFGDAKFRQNAKNKSKKGIIFIMWQHYSPIFLKISPIFLFEKHSPHFGPKNIQKGFFFWHIIPLFYEKYRQFFN